MFRKKNRRAPFLLGLTIILFLLVLSAGGQQVLSQEGGVEPAEAAESTAARAKIKPVANCRYGVAAHEDQTKAISEIGAGWFLKFFPHWGGPMPENNAEFIHVFKTNQKKTAGGQYLPGYETIVPLDIYLEAHIKEDPGALWVIGNEVDRGPNPDGSGPGQGDMYPEVYAQAYHEIRAFIKRHDPTARTAISGLVQVTPGRLQYLDRVWDAYLKRYGVPIPVDVWNMHIYVQPEVLPDGLTPNNIASVALGTDPRLGKRSSGGDPALCADPDVYCFAEHDDLGIFGEQVVAMRQWMKDHGQQQKPLILNEFSILYPYVNNGETCYVQDEFGNCFTPDRISNFMTNVFDHLNQLKDPELGYALDDHRLVQQWLWFSTYTESVGVASNIVQKDQKTLTQVGKTFQQAVYAEPTAVNLVVENIPKTVVAADQSGTATASIAVTFRNNGNVAMEEPFTVTFYEDQDRKVEIGSVTIDMPVRGCATNVYTAAVNWPDLPPGEHRFWVTLDSKDVVDEDPPAQEDNETSGLVVVHARSSRIPLVLR